MPVVVAHIDEMSVGRSFSQDSIQHHSVFPASFMSSLCIRKGNTDYVSS